MTENNDNSEVNDLVHEPEKKSLASRPEPAFPPAQIAILSLIGVFLLYQIGGSLITLLIFGFDFQNADLNAVRLLTAGGQILLIMAPALILAKVVYKDVSFIIRFNLPKFREVLIFTVGLIILIPLLQYYLYIQNYFFEFLASQNEIFQSIKQFLDTLNELVEKTYANLMHANNIFETALIVFVVSVVPAVCEETFFRGFAQNSLEYKYKAFRAALITSVFFSIYHFNPYGLIALIVLGTYLGFAAYSTNSIFIPMLLHFLNNLTAVISYFLYGSEEFMDTAIKIDEGISSYFINFIILVIIFSLFLILVRRYYSRQTLDERRHKDDMPEM